MADFITFDFVANGYPKNALELYDVEVDFLLKLMMS